MAELFAQPFFLPEKLKCYRYIGTNISVAITTTTNPTNTGIDVLFTTSNGEIFAIPDTATTTPDTGDKVRPKLEACSIGITK